MEIWSSLVTPVGKIDGFYDMIGKSVNPINLNNSNALDLYVPLYFWFCRNIGLSLPLIALQSHEVRFNVTFRTAQELVISSNGLPIVIPPNNPLQITQSYIDIDYIFLDDNERKLFAKNNHQYLIEQLQVYATSFTSNGLRQDPVNPNKMTRIPDQNQTVELDFNHPMKELYWVIQNSTVLSAYPYVGNEWFNFSTLPYNNGISNGTDPLLRAKLIFEGQDLFDVKDAKYFRTVIPYQRHTNVPNNFIYLYSFSLNPEEYQPSGSCNFSRIDSQVIYMEISQELIDPMTTIFGVNYNILNIAGGMAGVEYTT
jgi:hypothetical protein